MPGINAIRIIVIMGVTGAGKTRLGQAVADRLGCAFLDADDFHTPANVAKMRAGEPLTDDDRAPWLDALNRALAERAKRRADGPAAVLACSALRQAYRDRLAAGLKNVRWVHLRVSPATARARLAQRTDHFMPPTLIASQFDTLEPPRDALVVDAEEAPELVVDAVVRALNERG